MADRTKLQRAAICALADLVGMYDEDFLDVDGKRSTVELYDALTQEGVDVSDYAEEVRHIRADLNGVDEDGETGCTGFEE